MPFAADSGLVFSETVVPVRPLRCRHPTHGQSLQLPARWKVGSAHTWRNQGGTGASMLEEMATRAMFRHLDLLTREAIKAIPVTFVEKLWNKIKGAGLDRLSVWTLFAGRGTFDRTFSKSFHGCEKCTIQQLANTVPPVKNAAAEWLTDLALGESRLTASDLSSISSIGNLHILRYHGGARKSDELSFHKMIREWSVATQERQTFQLLEFIFVDANIASLQPWLFSYLDKFPALDAICFSSFGDEDVFVTEGEKHGWVKSDIVERFVNDEVLMSNPHSEVREDRIGRFIRYRQNDTLKSINKDKPMLRMQIGTMPPWSSSSKISTFRKLIYLRRESQARGSAIQSQALDKDQTEQPTKRRKTIRRSRSQSLGDMLSAFS